MEINRFRGEFFFLSNFFPSQLTFNGLRYESAEAAFQSMKTLDMDERRRFTDISPQKAKQLGRSIRLRPDWEQIKDNVMEEILREKFAEPEMRRKLLGTGDALLVEGNFHGDTYWGICEGQGQNKLGKLLMRIRDDVRRADLTRRLFVDLDGTVAEWKTVKEFEELYTQGYFSTLQPYQAVIDAIEMIANPSNNVEVFTLSAVISDSPYAIPEKMDWIDRHMPFIGRTHRIFTVYGESKANAIPGGIRSSDVLLDDYTMNLNQWVQHAKAVKLLNGINGTKGTWKGPCVSRFTIAAEIAQTILGLM